MSTLEPEDGAAPANSSAGGTQAADEGASPPGGQAPKKHRNPWIWVSVGLAVVVVGLLIWALSTRSDLDSANQDNEELQSQLEKGKETSSEALEDAKAAYDDVTKDLGATSEDLAAAEQDVDQAEKAAEKADAEANAAKKDAADANGETAKAKAEADQAKAEKRATESQAAITADCAKAYVSALGALFEGDSVKAQAEVVKKDLEGISESCQAALSG